MTSGRNPARKQAKAAGLTRYSTGNPCPQGHICERMVSSGSCVECMYARKPKYKEHARIKRKERHWADPQAAAEYTKELHRRNPEKRKRIARQRAPAIKLWHQTHPEEIKRNQERYRESDKGKVVRANNARIRRERMTTQIPSCADLNKIARMYAEAKNISEKTGILHVVDHVIPIDGEGVSGLHVEWNLQILTAIENLIKGDRYTQ